MPSPNVRGPLSAYRFCRFWIWITLPLEVPMILYCQNLNSWWWFLFLVDDFIPERNHWVMQWIIDTKSILKILMNQPWFHNVSIVFTLLCSPQLTIDNWQLNTWFSQQKNPWSHLLPLILDRLLWYLTVSAWGGPYLLWRFPEPCQSSRQLLTTVFIH